MLLPMISMLLPVLSMPAVTQNYGAPGWSAIAIGMSVGSGGSVLIDFAWTLLGPQRVASAHVGTRSAIFALATRMRIMVMLAVAPLALAFAALVPSSDSMTTALVCLAFLLMGLSGNWFFIGCGKPTAILLSDVIPRVFAVISAVISLGWGGPLQLYGWFLLAASILSCLIAHRLANVTYADLVETTALRTYLAYRRHRTAVLGRAVSSAYISLPVTLVAFAAPSAVHAFAAADSLLKMSLNVLSSVVNAFQKYVGSGGRANLRNRFRIALVVSIAFGMAASIFIVIFGPFILLKLMSGTVEIGLGITAPVAGVILTTCISRAVGSLGLVAVGRISTITLSAIVGAVIGVPAIILGAGLQGAELALSGMLVAEVAVLCVQVFVLSKATGKKAI